MFFIEVGTSDFDTNEQLIKNGWSGMQVEPVKHYFDKLPKYSNIIYENVAISDKNGTSTMNFISPDKLEQMDSDHQWMKGIGSLEGKSGPMSFNDNRDYFESLGVIKQDVQTCTLDYLCQKHNISHVDYLKIDTEGHDLKVLKSINLKLINVKQIKIEYKHLSENDVHEVISILKENNYIIYIETDDIYAIR
tara:strand:- start:1598 stop:2173 length:576 start_codon:yes stop_codon:yes gene_type:complete